MARTVTVAFRMTTLEASKLDEARKDLTRSDYLRKLAMDAAESEAAAVAR